VKTLPAQTPEGAWQFNVMQLAEGLHYTPNVGVITITGATVAFETNDAKYSFDVPLVEIARVTYHTKLKWATIKLKNGKSHKFLSFNEKTIEPLVEAIAEAMSGRPGPPLPPPPPKPNFAPIPAPPPVDSSPAAPRNVVGQTPDQVKATLGEPDGIDLLPSSERTSNKMIWYYKSLTVTFVDGKVSFVEQGNRPPEL
jgi:hypothetical protein